MAVKESEGIGNGVQVGKGISLSGWIFIARIK